MAHSGGFPSTDTEGEQPLLSFQKEFLGVIYQALTNDWVFADFPRFVLADR